MLRRPLPLPRTPTSNLVVVTVLLSHGCAGGPRGSLRGDAQQVPQDVPDVVPVLAAGAERQLHVRAVRRQGGVRGHQLAGLGQHPLLDQAPADRAERGEARLNTLLCAPCMELNLDVEGSLGCANAWEVGFRHGPQHTRVQLYRWWPTLPPARLRHVDFERANRPVVGP